MTCEESISEFGDRLISNLITLNSLDEIYSNIISELKSDFATSLEVGLFDYITSYMDDTLRSRISAFKEGTNILDKLMELSAIENILSLKTHFKQMEGIDKTLDLVLENNTWDNLNMYLARRLIPLVDAYLISTFPKEETHNKKRHMRFINEAAIDKVANLIPSLDLSDRLMYAEQELTKGMIFEFRRSLIDMEYENENSFDGVDYVKFLEYSKKARAHFENAERLGIKDDILYLRLAGIYSDLAIFESSDSAIKSIEYYNKLLDVDENEGLYLRCSADIINLHLILDKEEEAIQALQKGIDKSKDPELKIDTYQLIAKIYNQIGQKDKSEEISNLTKMANNYHEVNNQNLVEQTLQLVKKLSNLQYE